MKVEHMYNHLRYTLSNENLKVGDEVYPIADGRITDENEFIIHNFDFREFMCGFPNEPHIICDLNYAGGKQGKAYQIQTDKGFGPIETYYKIIKIEEKIKVKESMFGGSYEWIEFKFDK